MTLQSSLVIYLEYNVKPNITNHSKSMNARLVPSRWEMAILPFDTRQGAMTAHGGSIPAQSQGGHPMRLEYTYVRRPGSAGHGDAIGQQHPSFKLDG